MLSVSASTLLKLRRASVRGEYLGVADGPENHRPVDSPIAEQTPSPGPEGVVGVTMIDVSSQTGRAGRNTGFAAFGSNGSCRLGEWAAPESDQGRSVFKAAVPTGLTER